MPYDACHITKSCIAASISVLNNGGPDYGGFVAIALSGHLHVYIVPQHTDLHSCVEAAGANCQLIDSSQSVSMDTLLGKEAVVIGWKDSASVSAAQREWRDKVRQFLERYALICGVSKELIRLGSYPPRAAVLFDGADMFVTEVELYSESDHPVIRPPLYDATWSCRNVVPLTPVTTSPGCAILLHMVHWSSKFVPHATHPSSQM